MRRMLLVLGLSLCMLLGLASVVMNSLSAPVAQEGPAASASDGTAEVLIDPGDVSPPLRSAPQEIELTLVMGAVGTRQLVLENPGLLPADYTIRTASVAPFAASTELYGLDVPGAELHVVGLYDDTEVKVIDLAAGMVMTITRDLDRLGVWHVVPAEGQPYKVAADKPVVAYAGGTGTTFVPTIQSGSVGREAIFYQPSEGRVFIYAVEAADVLVHDATGSLVDAETIAAGGYWELTLSRGVYRAFSTGDMMLQIMDGSRSFTTVPAATRSAGGGGGGIGRLFYFGVNESV